MVNSSVCEFYRLYLKYVRDSKEEGANSSDDIALKQKKKGPQDLDEEDLAFKQKQKEAEAARKAAAAQIKGGKPLVGGGIKKSGKK